ncbi:MAG: endopeptidase La, partial [Bauldia sp.]|nr:endopeptidase La [Bauldia sp.]
VIKLAKDNFSVILQGVTRFEVSGFEGAEPFLAAHVRAVPDPTSSDVELDALVMNLKDIAKRVVKLMPELPKEAGALVDSVTEAGHLADLITSNLELEVSEKQDVLETFDLKGRTRKVLQFLSRQLEVLKVRERINTQVQEEMGRNQREYVLRQQLKAIKEELGELDDGGGDLDEFGEKITKSKMPEEAEKAARKQLERLKGMQPSSAEYTVTRTYLEWLVELPWAISTEDHIELKEVRRCLDEDHYDLDKVKKRIVEYMAVRKLKDDKKGPILCLAGPPGVGKTSLGQSIARAMGRKFVRVSLGGVHDEAEIRGHRRTYVGALPGNIIQGIRRAGARNAVMMLDEIDKLGRGIQGDPSAAMLEVLDPEQNATFRDNYLAVPFDLSRVVFITTANVLDTIPGPLRDRMEIIQLSGYTDGEKLEIAKRYLIRRQLEANGLRPEQAEISDAALRDIIDHYTRESGVRNLEREVGRALRYAAVEIAEGKAESVRIDEADLPKVLGPLRFENEVAMRTSVPGVATGLAWTPVGGDILFIEATRTPGGGRLILTGQLGEVMKESAQAALSLVKSRYESLGIDPAMLEKSDIHIHVPAGAIPKDGPSAGVAMTMALVSLFTNRTIRSDTAMTGEISLRGLVLPIGGVREKSAAAARAGLTRVMLPARNMKDVEEVSEDARRRLEFIPLETIDDAIAAALEPAKVAAASAAA